MLLLVQPTCTQAPSGRYGGSERRFQRSAEDVAMAPRRADGNHIFLNSPYDPLNAWCSTAIGLRPVELRGAA